MVVDIVVLSCRASCLKSLRLISCLGVSNEGIEEAIKQFPLLEELELSFCDNVTYKAYAIIGVTCGPQLKCLKLSKSFFDGWGGNEDVWVIKNMHELRSLQLFANTLTNKGLSAILDNCPNLESLDIRHCYNVDMDASLRAKCARIKVLRPPDDYDFHRVCTPRRLSFSTPIIQFGRLSSSRPIIKFGLFL